MITDFRIFENNEDDNIIEIDLNDIYKLSPYKRKPIQQSYSARSVKEYNIVMTKLKELLLNKYVSFQSSKVKEIDGRKTYVTILVNGVVNDIMYDNDWGNQIVYLKMKNENTFYNVEEGTTIKVNLARTDAEKYNL